MLDLLKKKLPEKSRGAVLSERQSVRLKECRHGLFMYNVLDEFVGKSLDMYGEFSEFEATLFQTIIKPGMVVIDVGANIGAHTVTLAKLVTSTGSVVAIEPQLVVFQMLCGNIAINNLENVTTLWSAAGEKPGFINVPIVNYKAPGNFGGISLESQPSGYRVPVLVLDNLNLPRCDFIKVDVEGMEKDVLKGAEKSLQKFKPIIYVENDRLDKSESLIRYLLSLDYRLFWDNPPLFNPNNYFGEKKDIFIWEGKPIASINMFGFHKSANIPMPADCEEITAETADNHMLKRRNSKSM